MTTKTCKSIGCSNAVEAGFDFCSSCLNHESSAIVETLPKNRRNPGFKDLGDLTEIDIYGIHFLFRIQDPSGCLQHASRQILNSGSEPSPAAIRDARDALTRWLQLNTRPI